MAAFVRRRSGFKGSTLPRGREKLDRAAFVAKIKQNSPFQTAEKKR